MIGERIRKRREELGISMAELARRAGISKGYMHQIERGRTENPSADVAYRLAVELSTTPADLLGKPVTFDDTPAITSELAAVARENDLTDEDVAVLANITYRGKRLRTKDDIWYVHQAIRRTLAS